jgi:redox-sensitive bicupin YhaK (pirin superfamily)
MLDVRRSADRGHFDHGWLDTYHSFSFADYQDPDWMEFGPLRVLNDDRVAAGQGFGKHGHRDMEIITYLLEGELQHRDSLGNGSVIRVGDVQRMSAGTGVLHSEFNPSEHLAAHLLQIWLQPASRGLAPSYEQKHFAAAEKRGRLRLIAAPDGADGALRIHQDARVYAGLFAGGERAVYQARPGRRTWLQVARGRVSLDQTALAAGDGAHTREAGPLTLHEGEDAEVLLFDLP